MEKICKQNKKYFQGIETKRIELLDFFPNKDTITFITEGSENCYMLLKRFKGAEFYKHNPKNGTFKKIENSFFTIENNYFTDAIYIPKFSKYYIAVNTAGIYKKGQLEQEEATPLYLKENNTGYFDKNVLKPILSSTFLVIIKWFNLTFINLKNEKMIKKISVKKILHFQILEEKKFFLLGEKNNVEFFEVFFDEKSGELNVVNDGKFEVSVENRDQEANKIAVGENGRYILVTILEKYEYFRKWFTTKILIFSKNGKKYEKTNFLNLFLEDSEMGYIEYFKYFNFVGYYENNKKIIFSSIGIIEEKMEILFFELFEGSLRKIEYLEKKKKRLKSLRNIIGGYDVFTWDLNGPDGIIGVNCNSEILFINFI